jgi:hypothetical protein
VPKKFDLVTFVGVSEHDYTEMNREPYESGAEVIEALRLVVGDDALMDALEVVLGGMIWWITDVLGYAIESTGSPVE